MNNPFSRNRRSKKPTAAKMFDKHGRFDRAVRDSLHRQPVMVLPAELGVTLIGDKYGKHVTIDQREMKVVTGGRLGTLGPVLTYGADLRHPSRRS